MNTVRTVSDTKRAFYTIHTRPINSIYRRVVEEMMVEMHLLSVNVDFKYDLIYALGVVMTFDQFMQGYRPEADRDSIFKALCQSVKTDPDQYRRDAIEVQSALTGLSLESLQQHLPNGPQAGQGLLGEQLQAIANNPKFKYSRLFATGIYALVAAIDADVVKDEKKRQPLFKQFSEALKLPDEKLQKDLDLYRSNLEKMSQAQAVMQDILAADRKKREEREQRLAVKDEASEAVRSEDAPTDSEA